MNVNKMDISFPNQVRNCHDIVINLIMTIILIIIIIVIIIIITIFCPWHLIAGCSPSENHPLGTHSR